VGSKAASGQFPEVDIDKWNEIFEVNVAAIVRGIQTSAPLIKEPGGGSTGICKDSTYTSHETKKGPAPATRV
jgi:NAD(P)-dependent dehydrogenase (short-subunit alcohol dehydrogenase family)